MKSTNFHTTKKNEKNFRNSSGSYELFTLTNHLVEKIEPLRWSPGAHVIGNSPLKKQFKKVVHAQKLFTEFIENLKNAKITEENLIEKLLEIGSDRKK